MIYAATGHRDIKDKELCEELIAQHLTTNPVERMIIGCAKGFDSLVGWVCVENNIPFDMYLPYVGSYYERALRTYAREFIVVVGGEYANYKYWLRDKKMVDDAQAVLAWYDGRLEGGTFITQRYAKKMNKPVHNIYKG